MKKRTAVTALAVFVLAILAAAGSRTFLGPCVHEDGVFGSCHWAGEAVFGISLLLALLSLSVLPAGHADTRKGLYLSMVYTSVLGLLIPGTLIRLCGMTTMRCQAIMRPAMTILFALTGILSLTGFLACTHKENQP